MAVEITLGYSPGCAGGDIDYSPHAFDNPAGSETIEAGDTPTVCALVATMADQVWRVVTTSPIKVATGVDPDPTADGSILVSEVGEHRFPATAAGETLSLVAA